MAETVKALPEKKGNIIDLKERLKKTAEEYITQTLPKDIPKEQKQFLIALCAHLGLDPYKGEIHFIAYKETEIDKKTGKKVFTGRYIVRPVVSYLVYIRRALLTGQLAGWKVEIAEENKKTKAVCTIHRKDFEQPFTWEVYLDEVKRDTTVWKEQPMFMLKKVCIAQAFRLAFPEATGELPYTEEEISGLKNGGIVEAQIVEVESTEKPEDIQSHTHPESQKELPEKVPENQTPEGQSENKQTVGADSPTKDVRSLF